MSLEEAVRENTVAVLALTAALEASLTTSAEAAIPEKQAPAVQQTTKSTPAATKPATTKPAVTEAAGAKPTLDEAYAVAVRTVNDVAKTLGREQALEMLAKATPKGKPPMMSLPRLTDNPKPSVDTLMDVVRVGKEMLEQAAGA